MYASPTFNALRDSADADYYNFGPSQNSSNAKQTSMTSSPN